MKTKKDLKPVGVKITRAERRDRKIILVIEPDLFSDEVFAVTPFYDAGDEKNKLQHARFNVSIEETKGIISAKVGYSGNNFTTGHSQIHGSIESHFIDKKDCALNWFLNEPEEYYTESRKNQILNMWNHDQIFQKELSEIFEKRQKEFKIEKLNKIKKKYQEALEELEKTIEEL
jgi:hypothetical protein